MRKFLAGRLIRLAHCIYPPRVTGAIWDRVDMKDWPAGYTTVWEAADVASAPVTATAGRAVVYKDTGSKATSPLLCHMQFEDLSVCAGSFILTWGTDGVVRFPTIEIPPRA